MKRSKWSGGLALLGGGVVLYASTTAKCSNMAFDGLSGATDFCFLFDCTNGLLNGLINPCAPIFSRPVNPGFGSAEFGENTDAFSDADLFKDCPDEEETP